MCRVPGLLAPSGVVMPLQTTVVLLTRVSSHVSSRHWQVRAGAEVRVFWRKSTYCPPADGGLLSPRVAAGGSQCVLPAARRRGDVFAASLVSCLSGCWERYIEVGLETVCVSPPMLYFISAPPSAGVPFRGRSSPVAVRTALW